jgi:hypothetical protein
LVNICAAFVTDAQAAELVQPTQGAFDHPAGFAQTAANAASLCAPSRPVMPKVRSQR